MDIFLRSIYHRASGSPAANGERPGVSPGRFRVVAKEEQFKETQQFRSVSVAEEERGVFL